MIKDHFTSRFKDGYLIEADWSQLEVCVFAFLTQDYQLLDDINNNVDIHRVMYSKCYGVPEEKVTTEQRKGIKACTFHVIYGGGAKSMANRMDLEEGFCENFINQFYDRYPTARLWQDNLVRSVEASKKPTGDLTEEGEPEEIGIYKSVTGRKYAFYTKDSPPWMQNKKIKTGFMPPEIKNYPVQGLATADLHMIALGHLWRESIKHKDKFLLINTIHDSVLFDCKKEFVDFTCKFIKSKLLYIVEILKNEFNIDFNVPINVEVKIGSSWSKMVKYEVK